MTDVMEDTEFEDETENVIEDDTDAVAETKTEPTYWKYNGVIHEQIPWDDVRDTYGEATDHVILESPDGGWNSNSGRPAYRIRVTALDPFMVPTEWGQDMFDWRLFKLAKNNWSRDRTHRVATALHSFLVPLARGEFENADAAAGAAEAAVVKDWPTWTGTKTRALISQLGRDIFNSDWRVDPIVVDIETRVRAMPGEWGHNHLRALKDALVEMAAENLSFSSDGDRWTAVRVRASTKLGDKFHGEYSDVEGSTALRDLLRDLWPDVPVELPEHIVTMTGDEAKAALALHETREKAAHDELWRKAEEKGFCPEFDAILVRAGYPPRPKKYNITYAVSFTEPYTMDQMRRLTGNTFEFADGAVLHRIDRRLIHVERLREEPSTEEATAFLTDEVVRKELANYIGDGHQVDNFDVAFEHVTVG